MARAAGWREFWSRPHRLYVNARHSEVHYARLAADILGVLPAAEPVVLDHGCGEALHADRVAARCRRLYLCDAAPHLCQRLAARFAGEPRIAVLAPEAVEDLPDAGLDLVVVSSLLQYLTAPELRALLALWHRKLKAGGRLVLADVLPPDSSMAADVSALLRLAWAEGFLGPALAGLAATFFSDYRRLRQQAGLTRHAPAELAAELALRGFTLEDRPANFGFNPRRMTFIARSRA